MEQQWFEMRDIRNKKLNKSVWIPLRAIQKQSVGKIGYLGYKEDFFMCSSLAISSESKIAVEKLDLHSINNSNTGYFQDGKYTPADTYEEYTGKFTGIFLVLEQHINSEETTEWHLHQDFVASLKLKRENDTWISPTEGYIEVARLRKDSQGKPVLLEVRAEHLKDYLCARNMEIYIASYFSRDSVLEDASFISWKKGLHSEDTENEHWEGRVQEIHEGGFPFGEKAAVFHIARTDVEDNDDIPDISGIPTNENTKSASWERSFEGKKLFNVIGELWRHEWIEAAKFSPRIKEDDTTPTIFFIVDEQGNKESGDTLREEGRWLWFKPDVIMALAHRRGGQLKWYTRDTGSVRCSPDYDIHFGINGLGLVNVYAKDVALLPEWQQRIWAGHNISPEGGVSAELLASQVRAEPADTQAPEEFLKLGIEILNSLSSEKLGFYLFREHELLPELFEKAHRFRAIDDAGLFALAKDIARLTADDIATAEIQKIVLPPKDTKWGSLKSLENLLASKIEAEKARLITGALVGAYELRHADAHLPGKEIQESFTLLNINRNLPTVIQGFQLLHSCVSSLYGVIEVLRNWDKLKK
jgi:hypothetical protein